MPAHHRFHPYEMQVVALYFSLVPCFAAIVLAFTSRRLEAVRRRRKPVAITRYSLPILLEKAA